MDKKDNEISKRVLVKLTSSKFITGVIILTLLTTLLVMKFIKSEQFIDGVRMVIFGFFGANTAQKFSK